MRTRTYTALKYTAIVIGSILTALVSSGVIFDGYKPEKPNGKLIPVQDTLPAWHQKLSCETQDSLEVLIERNRKLSLKAK